jgi:hypothetical protein
MTTKEKLIIGFKGLVILLLVLMIGLLAVTQWRSDAILRAVTARLENRLLDTMTYSDASVSFFRHFPSATVAFDDFTIGNPKHPMLRNCDIDLVLPLFPLLRGDLVLKRVVVADGAIEVSRHGNRWTYDLMRPDTEADKEKPDTQHVTDIRSLQVISCDILYDDGDGYRVSAHVEEASLKGEIGDQRTTMAFEGRAMCHMIKAGEWTIEPAAPIHLVGEYAYDADASRHALSAFRLDNPGLSVELDGEFTTAGDDVNTDLLATLQECRIDSMLKWLPADTRKTVDRLGLTGNLEGTYALKGRMGGKTSPHQHVELKLEDGAMTPKGAGETVDGLSADIRYDTGNPDPAAPMLQMKIARGGLLGGGMKIDAVIDDPGRQRLTLRADGRVPAPLLNLAGIDDLAVEAGDLLFDDFVVEEFPTKTSPALHDALSLLNGEAGAEDLRCTFAGKSIGITKGRITKEDNHQVSFDIAALTWHKAVFEDVRASVTTTPETLSLQLRGDFCKGEVDLDGTVTSSGAGHTFRADWAADDVEISEILSAFDEFGQTFITSTNLSGKADIRARTIVPMDDQWRIRPKAVEAVCAVEVNDGRLKGLKTLEDFSDYIHLADLRDIRFNQLRNYIRIANGEILLPVMFIQSSAINMSISGRHTFDQRIDYDIKLNAGQTLANRIKKREGGQPLVPSRKSGWINLYYNLSGTVSDVRYAQDRKGVLAGFESSVAMKESLRTELVDFFGYDVYWLEPNAWEDIPEYR